MNTFNTLRGFTCDRGRARNWYIDEHGIKRWVDTGKAIEAVGSENGDDR